jgi:hypothetical protein
MISRTKTQRNSIGKAKRYFLSLFIVNYVVKQHYQAEQRIVIMSTHLNSLLYSESDKIPE